MYNVPDFLKLMNDDEKIQLVHDAKEMSESYRKLADAKTAMVKLYAEVVKVQRNVFEAEIAARKSESAYYHNLNELDEKYSRQACHGREVR